MSSYFFGFILGVVTSDYVKKALSLVAAKIIYRMKR
jgi:hypothetical protein